MSRIHIDGHPVIQYSDTFSEKYWTDISEYIFHKYGEHKAIDEHNQVEVVLLDCFEWMADRFENCISTEGSFVFFRHVFFLHEESIRLNFKITYNNIPLHSVSRNEFAMYRRILKNILEQGCTIDLTWGTTPNIQEVIRMDSKVQELLYLGRWLYDLADSIALHKMINRFHSITFEADMKMKIDLQKHYGDLYNSLFPDLQQDYSQATADDQSVQKLNEAIGNCFGVRYGDVFHVFSDIKRHLNPNDDSQTVEPYVVPVNLAQLTGISQDEAKRLCDGLTLSRTNKMSIKDLVLKPYNMNRYMYKPVLVYRIEGVDRALVGREKVVESLFVMATNAIHWNSLCAEWLENQCMQDFINEMGASHDKILEDAVEQLVVAAKLMYVRNIKSFKRGSGRDNINIDDARCGEIDFIIINEELRRVFVADSKYNRARYEAVGYRNDYSQFTKVYEPKMAKKTKWVAENLSIVAGHFSIIFNRPHFDLTGFQVEGVFFINTPTFYMFNGAYKAVTLNRLREYLAGKRVFKKLTFKNADSASENFYDVIEHPYFK